MAGRQRCRNSGTTAAAQERETGCAQIRGQEEMSMCRYVNLNRSEMGCSGVEKQLCQTNRMLEEQNRLLAELLRVVQG